MRNMANSMLKYNQIMTLNYERSITLLLQKYTIIKKAKNINKLAKLVVMYASSYDTCIMSHDVIHSVLMILQGTSNYNIVRQHS